MRNFRGEEQRYYGAAPSPFAVYRPALVGMAGALPPTMLGICGFALSSVDIEACRTVEEYVTLLGEVGQRKKDLHDEYGVKPFTQEAQAEWATLVEMEGELQSRIDEVNARRASLARTTQDVQRTDRPFTPPQLLERGSHKARRVPEDIFAIDEYRKLSATQDEMLQAYRDGAMMAVERATYPNPQSNPTADQANIQRLLDTVDQPSEHNPNRALAQRILQTGTPLYGRAFTKYIQGRPMSPDEQRAVAPWTVQTDATGGYMVPFYFDPTLLHVGAWTNVNPFRATCEVKTIVGTDTFNGATSAAFVVARAAEAAAATEGLGAVGQISAIVTKVHGVGTLSNELLQDRPDVTSEIAALISEARDTEEENAFAVGIGGAIGAAFAPIGVLATGATAGAFTATETAGSTVLAAGDFDLVEAALPIRHRANAQWYMSKAALRQAQALETTGGKLFGGLYYANTPNPVQRANGQTGVTLLNYPVNEVPSGASGLVAQSVIAALINPAQYYIIERAGMTVEVIQHMLDATTGYPTGQRGIYAWWRNTAKPANVDAGRRLRIKT